MLKADTIPKILEKSLNTSEYRVINAGVRGFSTKDEFNYLNTEGHKFSPNYVFVLFSDNDLSDNFNMVNVYRGFPFINTHISFLIKFKTDLFLLLKKLNLMRFIYYDLINNRKAIDFSEQDKQLKHMLDDETYLHEFEKYAVLLNNNSNELNTSLYFILAPWLKRYQLDGTYNTSDIHFEIIKKIRTVLDKQNITYLDLTEDIINAQKEQDLYFKYVDGHFNKNGANMAGIAISQKFKQAINHA